MSAAEDKLTPPAGELDSQAVLIAVGKGATESIKNLCCVNRFPFNDATSGAKETWELFSRTSPVGDYVDAPIGSEIQQLVVVAGAVTDANKYIKKASGWEKFATVNSSSGRLFEKKVVTDKVDTAPTLTAAELLGGIITGTPTAARAYTLPAASAVFALAPDSAVGSSFPFTVKNLTAVTHAITVTASTTITNGGIAGDFTVAAATTSTFDFVFTNVTAGSVAAVLYKR